MNKYLEKVASSEQGRSRVGNIAASSAVGLLAGDFLSDVVSKKPSFKPLVFGAGIGAAIGAGLKVGPKKGTLEKAATFDAAKYSEIAEKLRHEFFEEISKKETQEHSQGSVPGTAFQGKETEQEEKAEVQETATKAGKEVAEEMGPLLAKVASVLLASAEKQAKSPSVPHNLRQRLHLSRTEPGTHPENDVPHSTPIGHGTPTMHKSAAEQSSSSSGGIGMLGAGGLLGAGAYGKSLYDRTKTLASSTSPSRMTTLGKTQAFKQTVATDVSTGISKAKSFGGLIRSRFPLRAL